MTLSVPDITPAAMQKVKDTKFTEWCGTHRMLRVRGDMFMDWAVPNTWSMHASLMVLPTTWSWRCVWAVLKQAPKVSLLMLLR